ncbi:hypothetical protein QBC33DRAFT_58323 [Phialemonium atrogriseum]|uniref:Uncharacterized protein n=1 Tax=Phialemonium atrogriseum TaxID=1093897 RepID=A0AAJ0C2Z0_9PEZI|nr:uncharacterized protein QBC33DRAFT_58323 [Phialemonium atrogriseum]KAK1767764.1 hypothetical protein QBC33DRAFT_58323 [Phialemonium atrogriseum]
MDARTRLLGTKLNHELYQSQIPVVDTILVTLLMPQPPIKQVISSTGVGCRPTSQMTTVQGAITKSSQSLGCGEHGMEVRASIVRGPVLLSSIVVGFQSSGRNKRVAKCLSIPRQAWEEKSNMSMPHCQCPGKPPLRSDADLGSQGSHNLHGRPHTLVLSFMRLAGSFPAACSPSLEVWGVSWFGEVWSRCWKWKIRNGKGGGASW